MKAAILIIGNEILSGRTQDINIQYMAERLSKRGIRLAEVRIVRDEETAVIAAAQALSAAYDYVFSTGGIGPTHDDITAECMAKAFGAPLEINAEAKRRLEVYYAAKNAVVDEGRLRMARIPAGAALIDNPVSAAPGFRIKNVYVMAGVPKIMQAMFLNIEPGLEQGLPMIYMTVAGSLRESDVAFELEDIQKQHPDVEIGSYPMMHGDKPHLNLVTGGTDANKVKAATDKVLTLAKKFDPQAAIA